MTPQEIVRRYHANEQLRKSLDDTLQDIQHYVTPFRGEFHMDMTSEHMQRWKRRELFDSTAPVACNLLASQLQGSMTSPSHKWFGLRFRDDRLNENTEAKQWLEESEERCWQALVDSDFNTEASEVYLDISSLGSSVIMMEEEGPGLVWKGFDFTTMPLMDTYFELTAQGKPFAIFRRMRFTTVDLINRWPHAAEMLKARNDSMMEKELKGDSDAEARHLVIFAVYYRENPYKHTGTGAGFIVPEKRPVGMQYVLKDAKETLQEGGYYSFPGMVVRMQKTAGSRWGYSPAMVCISDIKQLNELVAQTSEARAKAIDPPYVTTERGVIGDLDLEAGGLTLVTDMDELAPLKSESRFEQADNERYRLQESIRSTFYADRLELKDSPEMTATEVQARREQQRRMMAPIVGRIQSDFLEPLIINVFETLARMGQLPEQPEIVAGAEMDIEYSGELARAQKLDVAMGIERWLTTISAISENPKFESVSDLPNIDELAKILAAQLGVPVRALNNEKVIREMRERRAKQQEFMQQAEALAAAGQATEQAGKGAQAIRGDESGGNVYPIKGVG